MGWAKSRFSTEVAVISESVRDRPRLLWNVNNLTGVKCSRSIRTVPITLKGGMQWVKFFGRISVVTLVPFDHEQTSHIYMVTRGEGAGHISRGSATAPSQTGGAPALPHFRGSPLLIATRFDP